MSNKGLNFISESFAEILEHIRWDSVFLDKHHRSFPMSPPESIFFIIEGRVGSVDHRFDEANLFNWLFLITRLSVGSSFLFFFLCRFLRTTKDASFRLSLSIEGGSLRGESLCRVGSILVCDGLKNMDFLGSRRGGNLLLLGVLCLESGSITGGK